MNAPAEDRTSEVTHFHQYARWLGVMDSDRPAWLAARRKLVTASGVAALLGLHPKMDAHGLYAEMIMQQPANDVPLGLKSRISWGKVLERPVAEYAAECLGWKIRMSGALLVSRAHPDIGATLDAEIIVDGKPVVYEGKTTDSLFTKLWDEDEGRAPDHVLIQAQSQLVVTHADVCYVCALIGGNNFKKVEVLPSDELQSMIVETTEEFMEHVRALDPPPVTWKSKDSLKLLYPQDDGSIVQLPAECAEWLAEYQNLTAQIKQATQDKDELGNKLKASIGEATFGVLPCEVGGKSVLKYCLEHKNAYSVEPQDNRILRQLKSIGKGK